jgi:hypothetical protein
MTNPFTKIYLQPNFKKGHVITWELDPAFVEAGPWKFTLEVSETPTFTELTHTQEAEDVYWFVDASHKKQDWSYAWYYRVKLVADKKTYTSATIMLGGNKSTKQQYLTASAIIQKELLLMQQYTGKVVYLLKRKINSTQSAALVDPVSGVALVNAGQDSGTGFQEGYHKPIRIYTQNLDTKSSKKLNAEGNGVDEMQAKVLRFVGFPIVSPRDIIVFPQTDMRYVVGPTPTYTLFPGTEIVTVQTHTCMLLPNTDTVYSVPVPTT